MLPLPVTVANQALLYRDPRIPEPKEVISSWWWGASLHSPIESPGKSRLSEKWTVCSRHQQKPVGASAMWYHHISSTIPWYLDSINSIQLGESKMNPKPFEEKVLKSLIRVVSPASLSQDRSCRPQRSPGKGVPYSSATSSSLHEHLDDFNGFKMRMWNYGVMCNELICCSFGHASCVPRKKAASEWFAQRETKICDKHLSYWWPWIAQRHYHNSLCCASFALRSFCVIFLWTWRQKFLHKWRLATQLQPHGSSKSSSMVWFTQVVDVVVIVVDLTQHATSAWSSSNLKVWHFWISTGQKIGKTWNHRNFMKWKCSWMQSVENTSTVYSTQHEF